MIEIFRKKSVSFALVSLGLIVFSFVAFGIAQTSFAQIQPGSEIPGITQNTNVRTTSDVLNLLKSGIKIAYIIFFILAVLFILIAAFKYLTSSGDEKKTTEARRMIIYAAVAIAVALLAVALQSVVSSFLTTGQ